VLHVLALAGTLFAADSSAAQRAVARMGAELRREQLDRDVSERNIAGMPLEQLPDLSFEASTRASTKARQRLRALATVRERDLNAEERLTLRILRWQLGMDAEAAPHAWVRFTDVTPYASPLPHVVRAFAALPLRTDADVARYERLIGTLPTWVDGIRARLTARASRGIRIPKPEIPAVTALVRAYIKPRAESPFVIADTRLQSLDDAQRARVRIAAATIEPGINTALERLAASLEGAYLGAAPERVGMGQYPGGPAAYRWLVKLHTTTDRTPQEIHATGLREVARIEREMAAIRQQLGVTIPAAEYLEQLRHDPRFLARTPEEVGERLNRYADRIRPVVSQWFSLVPRAPANAMRLDPRLEPSMTFGYYEPPSPADSMGHYFFNGSKLEERPQISAAALIYHELVPGHHFQISLQLENAALPPFRQAIIPTAFLEGWGDYASGLAGEMGMYEDLYDRYGRLQMELFISCRLVVDTGMNYYGWPRDSAFRYMAARVIESPTQLGTEMLRYSVDLPAQALAYRIGALEIIRLREQARRALGPRFDIKDFHAVVLGSGALPLAVLGSKVESWIASRP
jgi:uncharacterized protein (DUF885 family)